MKVLIERGVQKECEKNLESNASLELRKKRNQKGHRRSALFLDGRKTLKKARR